MQHSGKDFSEFLLQVLTRQRSCNYPTVFIEQKIIGDGVDII